MTNEDIDREAKRINIQLAKEEREHDRIYLYGRDNGCPELVTAVIMEQKEAIERNAQFRRENY